MFCLFDLAWEKQQKRRQECKYLLELSKYKRGGWSIYPPDPVLQGVNVVPGLLISQLFLVALTSQTSSSSHGLAEGPRQSRESHTGHPWSEMLTARAESLDHEIVSLVWAETRGGPWFSEANTRGIFAVSITPTWFACSSRQRLSSLTWCRAMPLAQHQILEGDAVFLIETSLEYISPIFPYVSFPFSYLPHLSSF